MQFAFKDSMIHFILRFTLLSATFFIDARAKRSTVRSCSLAFFSLCVRDEMKNSVECNYREKITLLIITHNYIVSTFTLHHYHIFNFQTFFFFFLERRIDWMEYKKIVKIFNRILTVAIIAKKVFM